SYPWDVALNSILRTHGMVADETAEGIIEVHLADDLAIREEGEILQTQSYRVNYVDAAEILEAINAVLSPRGTAAAVPATNTLVVTDIQRVHQDLALLIQGLDVQTPQVNIQAKIIFVSRT